MEKSEMPRKLLFGVIVTGLEARTTAEGKSIITVAGERFWACVDPEGWVEAGSSRFQRYDSVPDDVKTFYTREAAKKFAERWKGHPWWCKPSGEYEIVKLRPKIRKVVEGFSVVTSAPRKRMPK